MSKSDASYYLAPNSQLRLERKRLTWRIWFLCCLLLTLAVSAYMFYFDAASMATVGLLVYLLGAFVAFYQPRYGLYMVLFFSLIGDSVVMPAYPFTKNFSSIESLFYLGDALIFSPMEIYLFVTALGWLGKDYLASRSIKLYTGELFRPFLIFIFFITYGLIFGIANGGDINIALWAVRPIYYLFLIYILTANLIQTRAHINNIIWLAMAAILVDSIAGNYLFFTLHRGNFDAIDRLQEHGASIHANSLFVLLLGLRLYNGSWQKKAFIPLMLPPVLLAYLANQRRAAYLTLFIALALFFIIFYQERARLFKRIAPPILALVGSYILIFWNLGGPLSMPAQAIKSVVSPSDSSSSDALSNNYRVMENINIAYTIHAKPITGIGFGNKFYSIVELPDISFFEWHEYITHNSIFWIWMKAGLGGFIALLYLIGMTIMHGVKTVSRMPMDDMAAIALTALMYTIMHFIFAYADISWDNQSMVYLGVMIGLLGCLEHVVGKPAPIPSKRWSWQPDPQPAPSLRMGGSD